MGTVTGNQLPRGWSGKMSAGRDTPQNRIPRKRLWQVLRLLSGEVPKLLSLLGSESLFAGPVVKGKKKSSFIADTGAGAHLVQEKPELEVFECEPVELATAIGPIKVNRVTKIRNQGLPGQRLAYVLEHSPDVLSVGCLVDLEEFGLEWFKSTGCRLWFPGRLQFAQLPIRDGVPFLEDGLKIITATPAFPVEAVAEGESVAVPQEVGENPAMLEIQGEAGAAVPQEVGENPAVLAGAPKDKWRYRKHTHTPAC